MPSCRARVITLILFRFSAAAARRAEAPEACSCFSRFVSSSVQGRFNLPTELPREVAPVLFTFVPKQSDSQFCTGAYLPRMGRTASFPCIPTRERVPSHPDWIHEADGYRLTAQRGKSRPFMIGVAVFR
jgi:hypothetical protein